MPLTERLEAAAASRLARNLEAVQARIDAAARDAGRDPAEIRLVAVTKKVPEVVIQGLLDLGVRDLGESRPEELARLRPLFEDVPDLRWHQIGPYQRKKITKTLSAVDLVHSVHDLALLSTLDIRRRAQEPAATPLPVLIQVNVSGESFLTPPGPLSELIATAVEAETGIAPVLSTSGGTSDARFVKDHCPVVEFGLVGKTMHQVDERVEIAHIHQLKAIYARCLDAYFDG